MLLKRRTIAMVIVLISMLVSSLAFQNCSPTQLSSASSASSEAPPTSFNCDGSPNDYYGTSTTTNFKDFICEQQRKPRILLQTERSIVTYPNEDEVVTVTLKLNKALESDLEVAVELGEPDCTTPEGGGIGSNECLREIVRKCLVRGCNSSDLEFENAVPQFNTNGDSVVRRTFWDYDDTEFKDATPDGKLILKAGEKEFSLQFVVSTDQVISKNKVLLLKASAKIKDEDLIARQYIVLEKSKNPAVPEGEATFTNIFQNIITRKCAGCHNSVTMAAGRNFMDFEQNFLGNNAIVDRENPLLSKLFVRTDPTLPDGNVPRRMPLNGPSLTLEEYEMIRSWLLAGAKKN